MPISSTSEAAIKGSIANPQAAQEVIDAVNASSSNALADAEPADPVSEVEAADATDLASVILVANESKDKLNQVIEALKAAGLMNTSF